MGNIYFIKCKQAIKIGFAVDVARRMSELQVGNAEKLLLLTVIPGTKELEHHFHAALAPHRIRGEWFTASAVRKIIVLLEAGHRPKILSDVEMLRDFAPKKGFGRGLNADEIIGFRDRRGLDTATLVRLRSTQVVRVAPATTT